MKHERLPQPPKGYTGPAWDDGLVKEAIERGLHNHIECLIHGPLDAGIGHKLAAPREVYRVEFPDGRGPYNSGREDSLEIYDTICAPAIGYHCARNAGLNNEQMGYTERAFEEKHGNATYACDSLVSLHDWFPAPARAYLASKGALARVYEVPAGAYLAEVGRGEVIYNRTDAKLVKEIDL